MSASPLGSGTKAKLFSVNPLMLGIIAAASLDVTIHSCHLAKLRSFFVNDTSMTEYSTIPVRKELVRFLLDTFRYWTGWRPGAPVMTLKTGNDAEPMIRVGNPPVKSSRSSGVGRSRDPRELYERTQWGTLITVLVSAVILFILTSMYLFGVIWVTASVLVIMIVVLACFSTLTVSVSVDTLHLSFGPVGLIRKSWPLTEIDSVTPVTNPWYYGWGIRWTPNGILYNVSGYGAVEVRLLSGKTFRIGTGEPDVLYHAIEPARAMNNS